MRHIVVIGAGLSGTLLMINLFRQNSSVPIRISWIDRNDEKEMGPAYSTNEDYLLNVPVEMMGAYSENPAHFLQWCGEKKVPARNGDYMPRKLYRNYIQEALKEARHGKEHQVQVERIRDEAIDLIPGETKLKVCLGNSRDVVADQVVLALGNSLPSNPALQDNEYIQSRHYIRNPWDPQLLDRFHQEEDLFFIGSGQTMTDLVNGLYMRNHRGRLTAISRRGILPMEQKKADHYPSYYGEIRGRSDILSIFQVVHHHLRDAEKLGIDPRAVIDSLRPHTIDIWMSLPPEEKRRFLRHLFRYWEIIRSRIPPENGEIIRKSIESGQLRILKGRITRIDAGKDPMEIEYLDRETKKMRKEKAHYLINCKGPNLDYDTIETGLIKNLIAKKIIQCDQAHLGINALPGGAVLEPGGRPSNRLYTIGPTLKGIVWESIATPEIRVLAENLARELLRA